jgi:hypothetical protein
MHHVASLQGLPHRSFVEAVMWTGSPTSLLTVGAYDEDLIFSAIRIGECDKLGININQKEVPSVNGLFERSDWDGQYKLFTETNEFPNERFDMIHVDCEAEFIRLWKLTNDVLVVKNIYLFAVWKPLSRFMNLYQTQIADTDMTLAESGTIALWRRKRNK